MYVCVCIDSFLYKFNVKKLSLRKNNSFLTQVQNQIKLQQLKTKETSTN